MRTSCILVVRTSCAQQIASRWNRWAEREGYEMLPMGMRVEVPSEYAFENGFAVLSVEADVDFTMPKDADRQKRDEKAGNQRVWVVTGIDLDPEASKFGRSAQVKVKVIGEHQPVPPASKIPGYPPVVEFVGLQFTPYVDDKKCKPVDGRAHKCKAQQTFSYRASGMQEFKGAALPKAAKSA